MIIVWLIVWLLESQPHVQILPLADMNTWGLTLLLAILLL
jgi:hypothetical protein